MSLQGDLQETGLVVPSIHWTRSPQTEPSDRTVWSTADTNTTGGNASVVARECGLTAHALQGHIDVLIVM